jgi:glutathione peroxidase-family protein
VNLKEECTGKHEGKIYENYSSQMKDKNNVKRISWNYGRKVPGQTGETIFCPRYMPGGVFSSVLNVQ